MTDINETITHWRKEVGYALKWARDAALEAAARDAAWDANASAIIKQARARMRELRRPA